MSKKTELSFKFEKEDNNEAIKQKINNSLDIINAGGGVIESFRVVIAMNDVTTKEPKAKKERRQRRSKTGNAQASMDMPAHTNSE